MATPTYKVVHQEHNRKFNPDGTTSTDWTVHLEHANGTKSQVVIPASEYTAANVHKVAQAQSDTVMAVAALPAGVAATAQ
jgi:hypothetical protein